MVAVKRLRAHRGVFTALFAVLLITAGASSGLVGYLASATTSGVRAAFLAAPGSEGALRVEARSSGADQDAAVRDLLSGQFPGVPLVIDRTLWTDPVLATHDDAPAALVLASLPVAERATLVEGRWATGADEGVLHEAAARALDLAPGAVIALPNGEDVTITGTWVPLDALDPVWFGDPLAASGAVGDEFGPLVVDEALVDSVRPFARWVLFPNPALVTADAVPTLVDGAATLRDALAASDAISTGNVLVDGSLPQLAGRLDVSLDALSGVAPVPAVLLGAIGLVALVELARLLVRVRMVETGVLRARGASAGRIAASTAVEAAVVAAPASVVGVVVAGLVTGVAAWGIAAGILLAAAAVFAAVAMLDARRPLNRATALDSGRGRRVAALGFVVLAVAAAIVSVWQFRLYGSPLVRGADGRSAVDPLAVLAPTLALVAGALLVVVLVAPATAALERLTRRARIGWALAGWQLARRVTVFATPVLLVALAVGGTVVAATYGATWDRAATIARESGNGAAVRVVSTWPLPAAEEIAEVDAMAPALTATLQAGDDRVRLLALPADRLDAVVEPAGGAVDGAALATAISLAPDVPLPEGTTALEVSGQATVWLVDEWGAVRRVDAPFTVPPGRWSLGAIDVVAGEPAELTVTATTPGGDRRLDLEDWVVAPAADSPVPRLVPSDVLTLPLAVSNSFAVRGGLEVGDEVSVRFEGTGRRVVGTISAVVPVVPSAPADLAIVADLPAFSAQQLALSASVPAANEVWISTADPARVAAELAGPGVRITTDASTAGDVLLASGRAALWIGAVGALVLATAAVGAIVGALLRDRSGEVVVLRAIGVTSRTQAASRRRELSLVLGWSVAGGVVVGAAVSALTVAELARSAVLGVSEAIPTELLVDLPAVGIAVGALILGLVAVVTAYGALVAGQARTLSMREDGR